jgi:hypothetical protein
MTKKWLFLLLAIPSLCLAASNPPWEDFKSATDNWMTGKNMHRLAVPHGWLVYSSSEVVIFVPDENHEWVLETSLTTLVKPQ